ncbi:MAG: hypothetical protein JZU52_18070 [Lamprocystis purpurea]|jgi:hypothetical protein|uniref:hypothetical protein n=1 Tax=Lamprocystis purpurea TaxID=61598 RepID=UPI00036A4CDA|nr:hypothetical protein [Lamprocystis purpurea]MBV5275458.1 hypothetical protein [Lamprocystis purpurea]
MKRVILAVLRHRAERDQVLSQGVVLICDIQRGDFINKSKPRLRCVGVSFGYFIFDKRGDEDVVLMATRVPPLGGNCLASSDN